MAQPSFHPRYRPLIVDRTLVVLRTEAGPVLLEGQLWPLLVPLIDGKHDGAQIVEALEGDLDPLDVAFGLTALGNRGYLTKSAVPARLSARSHQRRSGVREREFARNLRLVWLLDSDPSVFTEAFEPVSLVTSLRSAKASQSAELTVVVARDLDDPGLGEIDELAQASREPYFVVVPGEHQLWLGPLVAPWRRARWSCFAERLREIATTWDYGRSGPGPHIGDFFHREPQGADHLDLAGAATLTTQHLQGVAATPRMLHVVDVETGEVQKHGIPLCARCPSCRAEARRALDGDGEENQRLWLAPGDRGDESATRPLEETWKRFQSLVSPLTGLVHSVEDVPVEGVPTGNQRAGTPAARTSSGPAMALVRALHNYSFRPRHERSDRTSRRRVAERSSLGRGLTKDLARSGALAEALERASGRFYGNEPLRRARRVDLGEQAIHPNETQLYSERQYRERHNHGAQTCDGQQPVVSWPVPEPFDEKRVVHWVPARSISHRRTRYVAAATAYYGFDRDEGPAFAFADSNGCASGSTLPQAVLHGLLELVERDAVALWWYQRARCREICLDDKLPPEFHQLFDLHASLGRRCHLLDLTTDIGIPAFAAVSHHDGPAPVLLGFGAHLSPRVAAVRALSEMNQCLPATRNGRVFRVASKDVSRAEYLRPAHLEGDPNVELSHLEDRSGSSVVHDLELCIERVAAAGIEVLVIDQTRLDARLPTVRVVAPGLRPMRPRFAPGRLYEVSPRSAFIESRREHAVTDLAWSGTESDFNPAHLLL